jgi:glycosyltransferase involved in cell wall biosynthesis
VTRLGLRPYRAGDDPVPGSVPVSVVVLTLDEEVNIRRCLESVAWAAQVVVDSGSADATAGIARSLGAEVVEQPWLGYSAQRDFALRLRAVRHDWVYFVDADQWISPQLAREVGDRLRDPSCAAPAKPVALFCYMYLLRAGLLDGAAGLRFCFYHAWYEASVNALQAESATVT